MTSPKALGQRAAVAAVSMVRPSALVVPLGDERRDLGIAGQRFYGGSPTMRFHVVRPPATLATLAAGLLAGRGCATCSKAARSPLAAAVVAAAARAS